MSFKVGAENNLQMIGTSAKADTTIRKLVPQPLALVLGTEQKGLTPEQTAACT